MDSVTQSLDAAIKQLDERLRQSQHADNFDLMSRARDTLSSVVDEISPKRKHGLGALAQRVSHADPELTKSSFGEELRAIREEVTWIEEESAQARQELESRLAERLASVEMRIQALEKGLDEQNEFNKQVLAALEDLSRSMRGGDPPVRRTTNQSTELLRNLLDRVEVLERDVDSERERSIKAIQLVSSAISPAKPDPHRYL